MDVLNGLFTLLPFRNIDIEELHQENELKLNESFTDPHLQFFNQKDTSIGHLNTQSICSIFTVFEILMNTYQFDIMTLSETWLRDNKDILSHVKITGYNIEYNNRDKKRGGGVGMYIKDTLPYRVRKDITALDSDIEHLWVELKGRNKNQPYLVASVYQPKSDSLSKDLWIQKFETVLAEINNIWDGPIIICWDTNIDLLTNFLQKQRCTSMLDLFNIKIIVEKPTRKGKSLIDHILTKIPNQVKHTDVLPCETISDYDAPYIWLSKWSVTTQTSPWIDIKKNSICYHLILSTLLTIRLSSLIYSTRSYLIASMNTLLLKEKKDKTSCSLDKEPKHYIASTKTKSASTNSSSNPIKRGLVCLQENTKWVKEEDLHYQQIVQRKSGKRYTVC